MIISEQLEKVLYDIDKNLPDLIKQSKSDIDYLDISHSDMSKLSYITVDRKNFLMEKYPDLDKSELINSFWKKNRYVAKPGKIMRKIFPPEILPDKSIEIISNYYKGLVEKNERNFEIVDGYKIKKYFHYTTYEGDRGTLGQSCMRHSKTQELLNFYAENTNIKMLILYSKTNSETIVGRSLLWETEEGYKIMDRIYTIDSHYDYLFYEWASDNGYYRKLNNNWYDTKRFVSPDGKNVELELSVKLKVTKGIYFPYLDTFKWLDIDGTIYNYLPKNDLLPKDDPLEIMDNYLLSNGRSYSSREIKDRSDFKPTIKVLMNLDGGYSRYDTLLYDDIDKFYRTKDYIVKCSYKGIYTTKDRTIQSNINNDYILKEDATNDKLFGIIFNKKYDKYNNKKYMMSVILDKVRKIYSSGYINNSKFEMYKKKFEELETMYNKERELNE